MSNQIDWLRPMKRIIIILGLFFMSLLLVICVWGLVRRSGDSIQKLTRDYGAVHSVIDTSYTVEKPDGKRIYHDIILYGSGRDSILITLSLPEEKTAKRLPILMILGGLEIGRKSLTYIDTTGQNALIGYNYPYSPEYWYENAGIGEIPAIQNAVLEVPSQVSAILRWTKGQTWADTSRINLLGYSFGAIFLPSALHYTQTNNLYVNAGIMAYGGANLYELLYSNLADVPPVLRCGIAWIASSAIYPVEPLLHLPILKGEFLLINGTRDKKIPDKSWKTLQQATPEPKTIKNLDESHMHPRKTELTATIVRLSRNWLRERDYIN